MATTAQVDILLKTRADLAGMQQFRAGLGGLVQGIGGVKALLGGLGVGFGFTALASGFKTITDSTVKLVGEIEKSREQTGLTAEGYQVFAATLRAAGQEAESLTPTLARLSKVIGDAITGEPAAVKSLAAIGLSARQLQGLAPERQLELISQALSRITDVNQRAAASSDLLGKGFQQLTPLLAALGRDGFDRLKRNVAETNGLISNEYAAAIEAAGDRSDAAGRKISAAFAPPALALRKLSAEFKEFLAFIAGGDAGPGENAGTSTFRKAKVRVDSLRSTADADTLRAGLVKELESEQANARRNKGFAGDSEDRVIALKEAITYLDRQAKIQIELNQAIERTNQIEAERSERLAADKKANEEAAKRLPALKENFREGQLRAQSPEARLEALRGERVALLNQTSAAGESADAVQLEKKFKLSIQLQSVTAQIAATEKEIAAAAERTEATKKQTAETARRIASAEADRALGNGIAAVDLERQRIEANAYITKDEKQRALIPLFQKENDLIAKRIELLEIELALTTDDAARQAAQARLDSLRQRQGQNTVASETAQPKSFSQQLVADLTDLKTQFGTFAQQTSQILVSTIGTAISSISSSISGLILQTQTWGQALLNVGTTIVTQLVESIVQMGVRWIATQVLMANVGKGIAAASTAALIPIATAQASILAYPATLAAIASYGSAAVQAPFSIAAAAAATKAQALLGSGFAEGGYTGAGSKYQPAGIVHAGEYVMPASVVDRIGIANLQAIHRGYAYGGLVTPAASTSSRTSAAPAAAGREPNIIIVGSEEERRRYVLNSGDFDASVRRYNNRNKRY